MRPTRSYGESHKADRAMLCRPRGRSSPPRPRRDLHADAAARVICSSPIAIYPAASVKMSPLGLLHCQIGPSGPSQTRQAVIHRGCRTSCGGSNRHGIANGAHGHYPSPEQRKITISVTFRSHFSIKPIVSGFVPSNKFDRPSFLSHRSASVRPLPTHWAISHEQTPEPRLPLEAVVQLPCQQRQQCPRIGRSTLPTAPDPIQAIPDRFVDSGSCRNRQFARQ